MKMLTTRNAIICLATGFFWALNAKAATINAASCSQANVQSAINAAASGDTVNVPSGTCTWSSTVNINGKTVVLTGAGVDVTNITAATNNLIVLGGTPSNQSSRVTGFTFNLTNGDTAVYITGGTNWRIDHNKFTNTTNGARQAVFGYGLANNLFQGLFDHNTDINVRVLSVGEPVDAAPGGKTRWSEPDALGTEKAFYIEDNVMKADLTLSQAVAAQSVDTNQGGKYVFRFNKTYNQYYELHSVQGSNRGTRTFEIYKNSQDIVSGYPQFMPMRIRGGAGVIWGNTLTGSWVNPQIGLDNVRSYLAGDGGLCNGTSAWDGNKDSTGWPCRDQIGRGQDAFLWTNSTPYPPQASSPAYFWSNRSGSKIYSTAVISGSDKHIKNNRDFYDETTSFNGASGTGYGTLANRPTTCTAGVAYWATDQGNWNQSGSGDQGVLYKCAATNTWTLYYTPYTYPHPLQKAGGSSTPITPTPALQPPFLKQPTVSQ